jgi:hypothetical protein
MLGLAVQADLGDYNSLEHGGDYLSHVQLMPRLTASVEQQICMQHQMNRGKPPSACREELLGVAQLEAAYGIMSYQVQDSSRNPVTMTASPSGVRVLRGLMATNHYLWHTIIKISHRGRRLTLHISSQHLATSHTPHFTCSSSTMAGNMVYHLSRLRDNYTSTHTQRPSRLQRFFGSRRSVRVVKPQQRSRDTPSSNPLQRRSFAGETIDPIQFNHTSSAVRPNRSSLSSPPNSTTEAEESRVFHVRSESTPSRHSGVIESHTRQDSRHSHYSLHSPPAEALSPDHPVHPRQGSLISQSSHRSSPSRQSRDIPPSDSSVLTGVTNNHHGNYHNHSTPTGDSMATTTEMTMDLWSSPSPAPAYRGRENGHSSVDVQSHWSGGQASPLGKGGCSLPGFIPEEEGQQRLYPTSRQRHHSMRSTPPPLHYIPPTPPLLVIEGSKSSTFPREGSLSQPEGNTESVVDLLDEALEVLDEEEDQRKERERQRAIKPWKPQHRGRFRLSLQDSSYYDHRLYTSYRHFNRGRAFHGSKQSSSTTHLNTATDQSVADAQLQESLVELSQASDTTIDPHIRSFVFEGSHTETGATEL